MYSHDGKWIYFSSLETGLYCLYRIKADGSGKQQLSKPANGEEDARVCVSTNGQMLVFNKESGGTISIYSALLKT
jgi:Tol biopolymer transport system component